MILLVSITSIPPRLESTHFIECMQSIFANEAHLQTHVHKDISIRIVLNVPPTYQRYGAYCVSKIHPDILHHPKIHVHRPSMDYGPGTKLLGLHSFFSQPTGPSWRSRVHTVAVMDDDIIYHSQLFLFMCQAWQSHQDHQTHKSHHLFPSRWVLANVVVPQPFPSLVYPIDKVPIDKVPIDKVEIDEVQGFGGYWIGSYELEKDLRQLETWYRLHLHRAHPSPPSNTSNTSHNPSTPSTPHPCRNVDDTFQSFFLKQLGYQVIKTDLPLALIFNNELSDQHPPWEELKYSHREIDTFECKKKLISMFPKV